MTEFAIIRFGQFQLFKIDIIQGAKEGVSSIIKWRTVEKKM